MKEFTIEYVKLTGIIIVYIIAIVLLITFMLWLVTPHGWLIHDYLDFYSHVPLIAVAIFGACMGSFIAYNYVKYSV